MGGFDVISLTTDFGLSDGYVAMCHGVIARIAPHIRIIDVTHQVAPGDLRSGARTLAQTAPHLPRAVHMGIIDPGVGTSRHAIAIETPHSILVGPDNGLLIPAATALGGVTRVVKITQVQWFAPTISPTFHGRDIFAPSAAYLALGSGLDEAGSPLDPHQLITLSEPMVSFGENWLDAEVTSIDRFGNIQLAAQENLLEGLGERLRVGGMTATFGSTFGDVKPGDILVFIDSSHHVAIGINRGRAHVALSVSPGDIVRISSA